MKVLLDENIPHDLRLELTGHKVVTVAYLGWAGVRNGVLLRSAEQAGFELLITADQSMLYQQNLSQSSIALLVLDTNSWPRIKLHLAEIAAAANRCSPGIILQLEL